MLAYVSYTPVANVTGLAGMSVPLYWNGAGLPIGSQVLYQRLKERGVLIVPGHHCFFGLDEDWPHRHECIRVSYVQDEAAVRRGIELIADEVGRAYREGDSR